jgi:hypothetical protein
MARKKPGPISHARRVSSRTPKRCQFCGQTSWAGRTDLSGLFLCDACCRRGGQIILKARRRKKEE